MQIIELEGKFIYEKGSIQIDQSVTKEELKSEWSKIKFISDTARDIETSIREFAIDKFGEDYTVQVEADIITELGFTIKGIADKPQPVILPSKMSRVFQQVDDAYWSKCVDQFSSVETVRLYVSALKPMKDRCIEAEEILASKERSLATQ